MLPRALDSLVYEIESGHESSARLKKVLSRSDKGTSRANQLELITRVLDHACKSQSASTEKAFRVALEALRSLVPFLKKKTSSLTDTTAAVEKYAVNFALSSPHVDQSALQSRADELIISLERIFSARAQVQCRTNDSKTEIRKRSARQKHNKENENPDHKKGDPVFCEGDIMNRLFFPQATKLGKQMLLPNRDSAEVATTVAGALVIRLTRCCTAMCLSEILTLTEQAVLPWLRYVRGFDDKCSQRAFTAYLKRVTWFLLDQCRLPQSDPAVVLRTRLFALQLEDPKLNQFARDLLQCVNNFSRNTKQEKHHSQVMDTISSVYEEALRYAARYDVSDRRWVSEDVSAWLDNVASVWSKQRPRKPIPNVFAVRISQCRNRPHMRTLLECYELQTELFSVGAYELEVHITAPEHAKVFNAAVWKQIALLLENLSVKDLLYLSERERFCVHAPERSNEQKIVEIEGLRCLRLLRTLEPIRRVIASASSSGAALPKGPELVLRFYISALFRGVVVLSRGLVGEASDGFSAVKDILLRLNKMVGGGIEAARDLVRSYIYEHRLEGLKDVTFVVVEILKYHENYAPSAAHSWVEWLYSIFSSTTKEVFMHKEQYNSEEDNLVLQLSNTTLFCTDQMKSSTSGSSAFSRGYSSVLNAVREGLLSHRLWPQAVDTSLKLFEYVTSFSVKGPTRDVGCSVARMVAQDVVRLKRHGSALAFLGDLYIPADRLLFVFLEYSWWARQNRDSFRSFSTYLETMDALVQIRRAVLQFCDTSDLRCPIRRSHSQWLSFLNTSADAGGGATISIWKAVKHRTCPGHLLGLSNPDGSDVLCTSQHTQFLEKLQQTCQLVVVKSFGSVSEHLDEMELILSATTQLTKHLELMTVCLEALQWLSIMLAFNNFEILASRALSMAEKCGSWFNISCSLPETSILCDILGILPKVNPSWTGDKEQIIVKTSSEDKELGAKSSSHVLHEGRSDLKKSLKALWKFKVGLDQGLHKKCSIGGFSVYVGYNILSACGQHRLALVLEVIRCLFHVGSLQFNIENLSDGRYYMEQCLQICQVCFPVENNSFRRIASKSKASCMTRNEPRAAVQDSVSRLLPPKREDTEEGRDYDSYLTTLQTGADAMLQVETAWRAESKAISDTNDVHLDFILTLYERCQSILDNSKSKATLCSSVMTKPAHLKLNQGLAHLLKNDESTALQMINPLIEDETLYDPSLTAAALYHVARCHLSRAGGLRAYLEQYPTQPSARKGLPPRRSCRRRPRRPISVKSPTPLDNARTVLRRAAQEVLPDLGSFQLCRRVWNLAAMVGSDPGVMAWRLEKTIGLTFNVRYEHNMGCKNVHGTENIVSKDNPSNTAQGLDNLLQALSIDCNNELRDQDSMKEVTKMMALGKSILAGLHMDEEKTSIVVWRRCALGFHLRRLWIPPAGPQSYDGIVLRIETILADMKKTSRVREGHEMTKEEKLAWWEERYRLDNEMKLVLTEIQEVWLGSAVNILLPSLIVDLEEEPRERDFTTYVELGERALNASDVEVDLGHLILLVDKPSEKIPWESLPLLGQNAVSATRTPSLSFLTNRWNPNRRIDYRSLFYVLNPDGNLQRTEDRFREMLGTQSTWSGTTGQTSAEMVAASYEGEGIYLYCGHGAGEEFFSPSKLCVNTVAPVALLMGCSSCRSRDIEMGDFESNGPAIDFLLHGSPAVVGNLWDVSDGEIDRLTSSVLSLWITVEDGEPHREAISLAEAVAKSRPKCRLPYLVGAACIVMGVPDIIVQRIVDA